MVDAVYAPLFRYFGISDPAVAQQVFDGLPRISAWRSALAARTSVREAVGEGYTDRFRHICASGALIASTQAC
jgi:glutathione S-transferase